MTSTSSCFSFKLRHAYMEQQWQETIRQTGGGSLPDLLLRLLLLLLRTPGAPGPEARQPLLGDSQSCDRVRLPNSTTLTADVMMQSGGNVWHATANTRPPRKILGLPRQVVFLIHGQEGKWHKRQVCHKRAEFTDPNQGGNKSHFCVFRSKISKNEQKQNTSWSH